MAEIRPRVIWGKCITYLRENKNIALVMSCGDISEVEIAGEKFIASTTEEYLYNMISTDYAKKEIEKAFKWLDFNYSFEIILKDKPINELELDIEKISKIFGNNLKIIE